MATRAALAARRGVAAQSIDGSIRSIAAGLKIDVPPAAGVVGKNPDARDAAERERLAAFLALVAQEVGKPVADDEAPPAPADPHATPEPAENEPPHTQTVAPPQTAQPVEGAAGDDDEEVEEDGEDGQKRKVRRPRAKKK